MRTPKIGAMSALRAVLLLAVGLGLGRFFWGGPGDVGDAGREPGGVREHAAAAPTIWTCAMHPQIRLPEPGPCPICGMDLVPVANGGADESGGLRRIAISPAERERLRLETAPVERRFPEATVRLVGKVAYDETRLAEITAWVPGRIDRLFVDYTGVRVEKGDHMVELYSPELYSAQEELLQAAKAVARLSAGASPAVLESARRTQDAAREKLHLAGLTAAQVRDVEERGAAREVVTIYAPVGGLVIRKDAREGQWMQTGTRIFTIADLERVWIVLDAYESDLTWLRYGQPVTFTTEAWPGEEFAGTVSFIDPVLDPMTRTVRVRVVADNADGRLKPDMFVRAVVRARVAGRGKVMEPSLIGKWICPMHPEVVKDEAGVCDVCGMDLVTAESLQYVPESELESEKPLVIPLSAALVTGTRAIVFVEVPDAEEPTYEGREVVLGPRAGDRYVVRRGLAEGERVVVRGNFKLDSALQIQARPSMMTPGGAGSMEREHGGAGPGPEIPALQAIERAWTRIDAAHAGSGPGEALRAAFGELARAVAEVDAAELPGGRARAQWEELAMLLGNDAFEGGEARTTAEAGRVVEGLRAHVSELRAALGTRPVPAAEALQYAPPAAFRARLGALWRAYAELAGRLAGDDAAGARTAVGDLHAALGAVDPGALDGAAALAWESRDAALRASLEALEAAPDLDALRVAFEPLSAAVAGALRAFSSDAPAELFVVHCPMAFGRGASWLQADDQVRNPYFGGEMPTCGNVVERIAVGAAAEHGDGEASRER